MTIHNSSKWDLRRESTDGKNIDRWVTEPPDLVAAGDDSAQIAYVDSSLNGDTFLTLTYGVYVRGTSGKENRLGSVRMTVRIDCAWFGCSDYFRSVQGAVFPEGLVWLRWSDNGATPRSGYYADFKLDRLLAPGSAPTWLNCGAKKLVPGYANVLVKRASCGQAKRAIELGELRRGKWQSRGWDCSTRRANGRREIECGGEPGRFRFVLD